MKRKKTRRGRPAAARKTPPRAARKATAKKARRRPRAATPKRARPAAPAKGGLAARMTEFSRKVLVEEETPVAVRSWSEAKAGEAGSKALLPKTGEVTPAPRAAGRAGEPRMDPLTGPLAVPKDRQEEFRLATRASGKKPKRTETPDDFGPIELRQATATGGRHLTRAKADNLQRGASRIQPLATPEEGGPARRKSDDDVDAAPARSGPAPGGKLPGDLLDFGEVEIGQQTLSGSRKVGTLEKPEAKKARPKDSGDE